MHLLQRSFFLPLRFGVFNQSSTLRAPSLITLSNTRTFLFWNSYRSTKISRVEKKYKRIDKMPPTTTLIYNNPLASSIKPLFYLQNFMIIIGSIVLIYFILLYLNDKIQFPLQSGGWIVAKSEKEAFLFGGILALVLIGSSFVCKFTALRVYFDQAEKVYKAVFVSYRPFSNRIININPKSVTPVIRLKNLRTFEFQVDGQKMFLNDEYFRTPEDFNRMLKYLY